MNTSVTQTADNFATIHVAGQTVLPGTITGGSEPDEAVVILRTHGEDIALTPAAACALSAAIQSIAVHVMETSETERSAA